MIEVRLRELAAAAGAGTCLVALGVFALLALSFDYAARGPGFRAPPEPALVIPGGAHLPARAVLSVKARRTHTVVAQKHATAPAPRPRRVARRTPPRVGHPSVVVERPAAATPEANFPQRKAPDLPTVVHQTPPQPAAPLRPSSPHPPPPPEPEPAPQPPAPPVVSEPPPIAPTTIATTPAPPPIHESSIDHGGDVPATVQATTDDVATTVTQAADDVGQVVNDATSDPSSTISDTTATVDHAVHNVTKTLHDTVHGLLP